MLTDCDSYEHFPPKGFDRIAAISRRLPPLGALFIRFLATRPGRKFFMKSVTVHPPTGDGADTIFESFPTSKAARRDALTATQSLEPSVTLDAVGALAGVRQTGAAGLGRPRPAVPARSRPAPPVRFPERHRSGDH